MRQYVTRPSKLQLVRDLLPGREIFDVTARGGSHVYRVFAGPLPGEPLRPARPGYRYIGEVWFVDPRTREVERGEPSNGVFQEIR